MNEKVSAELLAGCVDEVRSGRLTIDECAAQHLRVAAELRGLLEVAAVVAPPPAVAPDPGFRLRARVALVEAIHADRSAVTESPLRHFWRTIAGGRAWLPQTATRSSAMPALIVALALALFAGGGAVYASQDTLPGDALYPIKLGVEDAQLALVASNEGRAEAHLARAARRAAEIERAVQRGRSTAIVDAADAFGGEIARAEEHVSKAAVSGKDVQTLTARLAENLARQQSVLKGVQERAPAPAAAALAKAIDASARGLTNASARVQGGAVALGGPSVDKPERAAKPELTGGPDAPGKGKPAAAGKADETAKPTSSRTEAEDRIEPGAATTEIAGAADALDALVAKTQELEGDARVPGQSQRGLLAKLEAAQAALDRGQPTVAANLLTAFRNELEAMRRSGHVDAATHAALSAQAAALAATLEAAVVPNEPERPAPREKTQPRDSLGGATEKAPPAGRVDQPSAPEKSVGRPAETRRPPAAPTAERSAARPTAPTKGKP